MFEEDGESSRTIKREKLPMKLKFKSYNSRMKDRKIINHHLGITLLLHRYCKTYPIKIKNRFGMRIGYTHTHVEENMMSRILVIPKTSLFLRLQCYFLK